MMNKGFDKINICFAIDDKYAEHCSVTIVSILKNSSRLFHFFILNSGLSIENKQKIERLKNIINFNVTFIEVNLNHFENCYLPPVSHFSLANYYRLKVASLLPHLDKVIYLDSDIIANRDLNELWDISLEDYYVGACKAMTYESNSERLGLSKGAPYINSGVLVLNLKKIRKNKVEDKFFDIIKKEPEIMQNADQDVINLVLLEASDGIKQLQQNWNTEVRTDMPFTKEYLPIVYEPYLIHFITGDKPWNPDSKQLYKEKYWEYHKEILIAERRSRESFIIEEYFNNDRTVRQGPFKGMNYSVGKSICSALLPKIYGSYEAPIQKWIQEVISNKYENIINIGCVEGYYAVGLALTSQNSTVYAYDIDAEALLLCKELARSNNVESRIKFNDLCTHKELENFGSKNTLVICDIEGEELHLLEPSLADGLQYADIIVETHDFIVDGISEILINRFKHTHKIEIITDYERESKTALGENISEEILQEIIDEKRPVGMKWLRMISLKKYQQQSVRSNNYAQRDNKYITQMIKKFVKNKKGVVYTCITGGYDALIKHTFIDHNWDYVCFTDDLPISNIDNDSWQVRPLFFNKLDNTRNQRWHKIHPHILFPEYKKSIWLDANINILNKDVFADIDRAIADSCLISVAPHPERNCIYDELIVCVAMGKDDEEVMRKQVDLIRIAGFPEKTGLFETNIMYRAHHNDRVIEIMKDWWWWIENYSRRDQLSLSYVLWQHKLDVKPLTDISYRYSDGIEFIDSPNHVTKEELIVQRDQLRQAINERDGHITVLNKAIQNLTDQVKQKEVAVAESDAQIANLNQVVAERDEQIAALYKSTSWRITWPLRIIGRQLKQFRHMMLQKRIARVLGMTYWQDGDLKISHGFTGEELQMPDVNVDNPLISVVMPIYNACRSGRKHFLCALESVANQSYKNIELIIVDDGSTDDTRQVCDDFLSTRSDFRAHYFSKKNNGQSSARNFGVKCCSGEYIAFIDQDDEWYNDKLEKIVPWLGDKSIDVLYTDADTIDSDGNIIHGKIHQTLLAGWPHPKKTIEDILFKDVFVMPGLMTLKKEIFEKVGGFDENLSGYEDDDLFLRLFEKSRIFYLPLPTLRWRMHGDNYSFSFRMLVSRSYYWRKLLKNYTDNGTDQTRTHMISLRFFWEFILRALDQYEVSNELHVKSIDSAREILPHLPKPQRLLFGFVFLLPSKYITPLLDSARKVIHVLDEQKT